MSCYRPITIANPKLVKNNAYDKTTIEVPCGHCHSCLETKRLSWFVRLYYEWQYCEDCGGFSLYETLTYNNENLPRFFPLFDFGSLCLNKHHYTDKLKGLPCFSRRDIQLYLKKIRKALTKFFPNIDIKGKVKYFLSMELGDKFYRPHYHVIFFVSCPDIPRFVFKRIVESLWQHKGFTKQGKLNYGFVNNVGGLSYAAKYVCKDIFEYEYWNKVIRRFDEMKLHKEDYLDGLPRNMQSTNLGVYALECDKYNDLYNFMLGEINLPDKVNEIRKYKLPLYFEHKLFYDVKYRYFNPDTGEYISVDSISQVPNKFDYSPIYVLNDLGLEMKDIRLQKSIDAVKTVYRVVQGMPNDDVILSKLNKKYETKFKSFDEFKKHIRESLSEKDFIQYSLVYRGCPSVYDSYIPSVPNSDIRYNYHLVNYMSRDCRPLSVDYNNFIYHVDKYTKIPYIEDNYQMIRYVYFLIHLSMEKIFKEKEREYIENKSLYLLYQENIV